MLCAANRPRRSCSSPHAPAHSPEIVIGQEATGPNRFIRRIAATLAHLGHVALVPDYYHGGGPPDHENYDDIETIIEHMAVLDFRRGAYDLVEAVEHLKRLPNVDHDRVGLWGYCTGATITLLSACLCDDLAATVLFYPSQPRFETLDVNTPVHPIDMVWNLTSPVLLIVGENDPVWPPELVADVRHAAHPMGDRPRHQDLPRCRARLLLTRARPSTTPTLSRPLGETHCGFLQPTSAERVPTNKAVRASAPRLAWARRGADEHVGLGVAADDHRGLSVTKALGPW